MDWPGHHPQTPLNSLLPLLSKHQGVLAVGEIEDHNHEHTHLLKIQLLLQYHPGQRCHEEEEANEYHTLEDCLFPQYVESQSFRSRNPLLVAIEVNSQAHTSHQYQ